MKHTLYLIVFIFVDAFQLAWCHPIHYNEITLREWCVDGNNFYASFLSFKNDSVFLETEKHMTLGFPLEKFHGEELAFIKDKISMIQQLNQPVHAHSAAESGDKNTSSGVIISVLLLSLIISIRLLYQKRKIRYSIPVIILGASALHLSFTDPNVVRSAFLPFAPEVNTFWDDNYFYVESKGIPSSHEMMIGISSHGWQQQVPIPQCYIGSNAWSIPLNPVMSANPIPVDQVHFTRGAIAIAVNGVPIFNPYTNTGVDAFLDGQLDHFGGHCGRGDDYHYHTAPLHLYGQTISTLPIAYAFDGFAVYGATEPDGSALTDLDTNHGHFYNGEYHYHGTADAPYMIARFAGVVTEDNTHQLVPQAQAHPVRTEDWTPLNGALITSCEPNTSGNGYNLSYSLNGTSGYATNYSWNTSVYSFNYVSPSATINTVYNGFAQCEVPVTVQEHFIVEKTFVYPNPFHDKILAFGSQSKQSFVLMDVRGNVIFSGPDLESQNFSNLSGGIYFLRTHNYTHRLMKR